MKLRPKIVSLILVVFLGYLGASFAIQRLVILPSFVALEEEKAIKNVVRCRDALMREIDHLKVQCHDWASWDETYDFVEDQNETYINNNLILEAFENTELNLMYFISEDGNLVWGKVYDLSGDESLEMDPVMDDLAKYPKVIHHDIPDSEATGIISTRHGPMLIASLPILTNENEGPIHGTLVMGRLITDATTAQIAEQTKVDFDLWTLGDPDIPEEDRLAVQQIGPDEQVMLRESEDELAGYSLYSDMNGKPMLMIRAYLPKDIVARGAAAMHFATLSICVAGLVTMLLLLIAMQRMVINPIDRLTRHTGEVGMTSNLTTRIAMNRSDEIGTLADTLDRMVDQLSDSRTALSEASRAAGKAEVASRVLHNVGNVLNSVNVSAETALNSAGDLPVDDLRKVAAMLREHADDLGSYVTEDPRGRLIPEFIDELGEQMVSDRVLLVKELHTLTEQINHIKSVVAMQQGFSKASKVEEIGSIQDVVGDAIKINSELIRNRGVRVTCDFEKLPAVWFDRHMLMDIMINLVSNAVHALDVNPHGSRVLEIAIRVSGGGGHALVVVKDNGTGIEPGLLTKIFNHGFTTRADGHGFGLHSAALAAKELGGSLKADSDGPGRGATFTLKLPMKTAEVIAA